jgi:hypothetical protein
MSRDYKKIFVKVSGLQNNLPEYRLYSPDRSDNFEEVKMPLSGARDVLIDDSLRARTRPGYGEVDSSAWHSLFCDTTDAVGVRGQDLVLINASGIIPTFSVLTSGITDRVSYAQVNNEIYYTSGAKQGRVVDGRHLPWLETAIVPYETNRSFVPSIPAKLVAFHLARIWLAQDNFVVFSEPLGFSLFDLHQNSILFDDEVVMMRPVKTGIFISTTKKVYFLSGNEPNDLAPAVVAHAPALPWSDSQTLIESQRVGLEPGVGKVAAWVGTDGIYFGTPDGVAVNATEAMIEIPPGYGHGASVPFEDHLFFCMNKS